MRLFELFDDTYDTQVTHDDDYLIQVKFETDDNETIIIEFSRLPKYEGYTEDTFEVTFKGSEGYNLTNRSKNPYKVFATVIKEITQFMNRDDVQGIMIYIDLDSGKEVYDSRTKVYKQLLKRFAKNYNIEEFKSEFGDEYGYEYIITK